MRGLIQSHLFIASFIYYFLYIYFIHLFIVLFIVLLLHNCVVSKCLDKLYFDALAILLLKQSFQCWPIELN